MTLSGRGTPLPLDAPQKLVTHGPYAFVRDPMAMAGLGQGFSVALALSSFEVAAYVVVGMLVWNYFLRSGEETYMQVIFGTAYDHYQGAAKCWIPRRNKYVANWRASGGES